MKNFISVMILAVFLLISEAIAPFIPLFFRYKFMFMAGAIGILILDFYEKKINK